MSELTQFQLERLEDEAIDRIALEPDDAVAVFDYLHKVEAERDALKRLQGENEHLLAVVREYRERYEKLLADLSALIELQEAEIEKLKESYPGEM